jgi:hypothetical protein
MPSRRKLSIKDTGIYQVDLIASLFAAFTIIWIARADDADILYPETDLAVVTLRIFVEGTLFGEPYLHRASVLGVRESVCVEDDFDDIIDTSEIDWETCEAVDVPFDLNRFNDAVSIVERNEINDTGVYEAESCYDRRVFSDEPDLRTRVIDASLLDLELPAGLALVGYGYGEPDFTWPPTLFGGDQDVIPKYVSVLSADWDPRSGDPPFECAYERDTELVLEALYISNGFADTAPEVIISLASSEAFDLFHVFNQQDEVFAFRSRENVASEITTLPSQAMSGRLRVGRDFDIEDAEILFRLCHHENGNATCWQGRGDLEPGQTYTLYRES